MKERLSAYLAKRQKGFTLVELLVVIAIIAILVLLVIVALDPLERIQDANDRDAQNAVRQAGSALAACIVDQQAQGNDPFAAGSQCSSAANLAAAPGNYISNVNSLAGVAITLSAGNICAQHDNTGGHGSVTWNFDTGTVSDPEAGADTC